MQVLANTQLPAEGPRKQAELDLKNAQSNPAYPLSLANVAAHSSISGEIRQAALTSLRQFIERNWSGESDEGPTIPIADAVKEQIRPIVLGIALNVDDRRIKTAASYAVGKIANVDFPENWPTLLPTLLGLIPTGNEGQLHGALKVLGDLVEETLSDDQFFSMARDIVKVVYDVALDQNRKPILRALAISVFRGCFQLMDIVKEEHPEEVQGFADQALKGWFPFFHQILNERLPDAQPQANSQPEAWNGPIALKLQVVKCLLTVKMVFPQLLLPETPRFFQAVWEELSFLESPYEQMYIESGSQGRLEDSDGLPYTLDFLVLEELDFLNGCLKAPPVRKELDGQLNAHAAAHETPWVLDIMKLATSYARITQEEEELWEFDVSLYLAEETSVSANYTPRTASGDLLIKLGHDWLNQRALEGLFAYTKTIFDGNLASWRRQEAALYLVNMLVSDFIESDKQIAPEITQAYLELVSYAIGQADQPLLRGRGYLLGGLFIQCNGMAAGLMDRTIEAITGEQSELVQVACIKATEGYIKSESQGNSQGHNPETQAKVVGAISQWIAGKDMTDIEDADDLLVTLAETLRAAIFIDTRVAVSNDFPALDLLFLIAKHGASNWQVRYPSAPLSRHFSVKQFY